MRNTLLMSAALLSFAAMPALAQMSPAPNATAPADPTLPGTVAPVPGRSDMTGMRPMRGQQPMGEQPGMTQSPGPMRANQAPMGGRMNAPSTGEYRGGAGSPMSTSSSNSGLADTRSEIAPRLPNPDASSNSPEAYLAAAQRALAAGRTGAAQEALERAETRLLTRSTEPGMAATPSDMPMVRQISDARRALANRDMAGARAALRDMPMSDGGQSMGRQSMDGQSMGGGAMRQGTTR